MIGTLFKILFALVCIAIVAKACITEVDKPDAAIRMSKKLNCKYLGKPPQNPTYGFFDCQGEIRTLEIK